MAIEYQANRSRSPQGVAYAISFHFASSAIQCCMSYQTCSGLVGVATWNFEQKKKAYDKVINLLIVNC